MTKRLPSEFAINMNLEKMLILQQSELEIVNELNFFNANSKCHIYFICRRPRVVIDPKKFKVTEKYIELTFKIQKENEFSELTLKIRINLGTTSIELKSDYPYSSFQILSNGKIVLEGKAILFLQAHLNDPQGTDFLNLEVLYIGQSYGVDGARTAPDRLKNHSTLQGIYSKAISRNPDSEIWIALASFSQVNITVMDGKTQFSEEELDRDKVRYKEVNEKLNWEGINEQQKINFTEAALIKYFQPHYNKIYKDSFPNPAHKTYSECYELDINSVGFELNTYEAINCFMYSQAAKPAPWHMEQFLLNSQEERKNMFDFF